MCISLSLSIYCIIDVMGMYCIKLAKHVMEHAERVRRGVERLSTSIPSANEVFSCAARWTASEAFS